MRVPRFLFSHYSYTGISAAAGVFLVGLLGYLWGGWPTTAALTTGACAIHFVDGIASPGRQKLLQILPPLFACTVVTLLILLCEPLWLRLPAVLLITMASSMLSVLGKSMMPFSFTLLYSMMMAMATPVTDDAAIYRHVALFALGGVLYSLYVCIKEYVLEIRSKQQILSEVLDEFARYLKRQARLYDTQFVPDAALARVIGQQAILAEKLQAARNILFQRIQNPRSKTLAGSLFILIEAYENALSNHAELIKLAHYQHTDSILSELGIIVKNSANDLTTLSTQIMRNQRITPFPDYQAQLTAIQLRLENLPVHEENRTEIPLQLALIGKIRILLHHLDQLAQPVSSSNSPLASPLLKDEKALQAFVSPNPLQMREVRPHLRKNSPAIRYTIRMTLAMTVAFALANANILPYNAHSYWIILSLAVILRSSYSQTKQRSIDRIVGTLSGCVIGGIILTLFDHSLFVLLCALFVSIAVAKAMLTIRYRYTSAAAAIMGMIQIHMLNPSLTFLPGERMIDTLIGAGLAYLFSFILPNWEHRYLPALIERLTTNCKAYAQQALTLAPDQTRYRLTRRALLDTLATFSQMVDRMLDEPKFRQTPIQPLQTTTTQGYKLAAHMTALRAYLINHREEINTETTTRMMDHARKKVIAALEKPLHRVATPHLSPEPTDMSTDDLAPALEQQLVHICTEAEQFSHTLYNVLKSYRRTFSRVPSPHTSGYSWRHPLGRQKPK